MKIRNPLFDAIKFLAILMVVYWHVLYASPLRPTVVINFIVGCNMPIFFLVSGYFLWGNVEKGDWRKFVRHLYGYFVPFVCCSVLFAMLSPCFGLCELSAKGVVLAGIKRGLFGGWFIWSLAFCYVVAFMIARLIKAPLWLFLAYALLEIGLLFVSGYQGIIYHPYTRSMFPYFVIGMLVRYKDWKPWEDRQIGFVSLALFLAVVFFEDSILSNGMGFYWTDTSYVAFGAPKGAMQMFARPIVGCLGTLGLLSAINEITKRYPSVIHQLTRGGG